MTITQICGGPKVDLAHRLWKRLLIFMIECVKRLGVYFADDLDRVAHEAERASIVTHSHLEAIAGAIAVAETPPMRVRSQPSPISGPFLISSYAMFLQARYVTTCKWLVIFPTISPSRNTRISNGSRISAQDTVPFVLWCAAHHLHDFEEAIWTTLGGFGDMDTNAAMVGGIVAPDVGWEQIPTAWRQAREPLPDWLPRLS